MVTGRVAVIDHFGNAITTIREADFDGSSVRGVTWPGGSAVGLVSTYAHIDAAAAALIGSAGHLEVAARGAPVLAAGGPRLGDPVEVHLA